MVGIPGDNATKKERARNSNTSTQNCHNICMKCPCCNLSKDESEFTEHNQKLRCAACMDAYYSFDTKKIRYLKDGLPSSAHIAWKMTNPDEKDGDEAMGFEHEVFLPLNAIVILHKRRSFDTHMHGHHICWLISWKDGFYWIEQGHIGMPVVE